MRLITGFVALSMLTTCTAFAQGQAGAWSVKTDQDPMTDQLSVDVHAGAGTLGLGLECASPGSGEKIVSFVYLSGPINSAEPPKVNYKISINGGAPKSSVGKAVQRNGEALTLLQNDDWTALMKRTDITSLSFEIDDAKAGTTTISFPSLQDDKVQKALTLCRSPKMVHGTL